MKIHSSFGPWAARLARGAGGGPHMSVTAPATPLSPFFRQFPAHFLVYGKCLHETEVSFNLPCKMDCQVLARSYWEVPIGSSAPGAAAVITRVMMAVHKSQGAPTPTSFPEIPLSVYGGTPSWTLSIAIPFYRWGKSWLAKFYSKNDVLGLQGQRTRFQENQSQILCLVMIVLSGFYYNFFSF